jgi:hypothetical protein
MPVSPHSSRRLRPWLVAGALLFASLLPARDAPPAREFGQPFFEVFDPREYRGHTQVWSAVEDAAGLVYFGNYDGVLIYDGARWDRLPVPGATFVRGLAVDAEDTLWIGGVNELGYAKTDATGRRTFVSLRDRLPEAARNFGELWRLVLTPRGPVFQSNTWVLRWDGTAFATVALPEGSGWQLARAGDTCWVTHGQHGWFTLQDDGAKLSLVAQTRPAAFANAALMFAVPGDRAGEFLFGTARLGLLRWAGGEFTPFATEADDTLKQKRLYRGIRLADGRLVLTTIQSGALILDAGGRLLARLDEAAGLTAMAVPGVFAARDGAVWLCLYRGMARVDARNWLTWFGPAQGAPRSPLRAPVRFQGGLYTTSDDGLMRVQPGQAGAPARLVPVPEFLELLEGLTLAGDKLIGYGTGIAEWAGPGKARVPLPGNVVNAFDFTPARSQPGRWFAVMNGGLHSYRRAGDTWVHEGPVPDLGMVRSLSEEPDGTWWMGTPSDGVLRVTFPAAAEGGPGAPVITRFNAQNGGLPAGHGWARVSQYGGRPLLRCERGFFRLDAGGRRWEPTAEYGARFADGSMTARSLTEGPDGLWIAGRPAGEAELVSSIEFGVAGAGGWRPVHLPMLTRLDDISGLDHDPVDDVLWIAGHAGLVRMDLAGWRAAPPEPPPRVVLRAAATNDGARLDRAGGWSLAYARRAFDVQFAAPALARDPAALYESTLFGGGEPVVLTDGTPHREFSALASGDYRLRLRARAGDGRWSEPIELAFTIQPPWWRSGWAWAAYVLLGAGLIAAYIRTRTRALRRRAEQLEATVAARTEELRRSNAELVRLNKLELDEKIAARLAEEKARLEVLRYQLNPHFLFNALTSVCSQLPPSLGGARAILERLTDFCQLTLFQPANGESPTLAQEMKMLTAYLDIEQTRWGDLLEVSVEVDPTAADAKIPSLLLLPLVENAFKYGQATSRDKLRIRLSARREPSGLPAEASAKAGALLVEVANTGQWVAPTERGVVPSLGIGHENLRQRLQRYYPGAHEFTTTAADGWVTVRLRLSAAPRE